MNRSSARAVRAAAALVLMVLGSAAPAAASVSVPSLSLTEGVSFDGTVATVVSRCDAGALTPQVAWGDGATSAGAVVTTGQSTFAVHAAHTYTQAGRYGLAVTVKDCSTGGIDRGHATAQVADAALTAKGLSLSATADVPFSGPVAEFVDDNPSAMTADFAAAIDWGDGHSGAGTVVAVPGGGFRVTGGASYPAAGHYTVTVKIADAGGASGVATSSITVAAAAATPARHGFVAVGSDRWQAPRVRVYDAITGQLRSSFLAYPLGFRGGVRVAVGDVTGDGIADIITAPGSGTPQCIKVFDGASGRRVRRIWPFGRVFHRGVYVAAGDVSGDHRADVIVGAGAGATSLVEVLDGTDGHKRSSVVAYDAPFRGGVRVAAGDIDHDGRADVIVAPGAGGSPHIKVLSGAGGATLMSFFAYSASFTRGVYVAAGDVNGDGHSDVITGPGPGAGSQVTVFSGASGAALMSALAFGPSFLGGARVAATDIDGDGRADVIAGAGPGGGPHVKTLSGADASTLSSFFAGSPTAGAVFVAAGR